MQGRGRVHGRLQQAGTARRGAALVHVLVAEEKRRLGKYEGERRFIISFFLIFFHIFIFGYTSCMLHLTQISLNHLADEHLRDAALVRHVGDHGDHVVLAGSHQRGPEHDG